jgi:hypothetical protein
VARIPVDDTGDQPDVCIVEVYALFANHHNI